MDMKSFLAGGAVAAVLASIVAAEQISVPHQFTAGSPARASEVNENFDVIVQESNAQDVRIAALKGDFDTLSNVEQLFCSSDPRPSKFVPPNDPVGGAGFPIPFIRFRNDEVLALISEAPALCISLSDPATFIETNSSQLAADGWMFRRHVENGEQILVGGLAAGKKGGTWYLFER